MASCLRPASAQPPAPVVVPDRSALVRALREAESEKWVKILRLVHEKYPAIVKDIQELPGGRYRDLEKFMTERLSELMRTKYPEAAGFVQSLVMSLIQRQGPEIRRELLELIQRKYPALERDVRQVLEECKKAGEDPRGKLGRLMIDRYPQFLNDVMTVAKARAPRMYPVVVTELAKQYPQVLIDLVSDVGDRYPNLPDALVEVAGKKYPNLLKDITDLLSAPTEAASR